MKINTDKSKSSDSKDRRRLKVLISAYACEPGKGSEPGVGWSFSVEMAKYHDVWVLTRSNNRRLIEEELRKNPVEGLYFIYHDLNKLICWWKKGGRGVQFYYNLWQLSAVSKLRKKHDELNFDLSHHVTFVKYWAPSCLAWLDIPFIWGPVGGGESLPPGFSKECSLKGRLYEWLRSLARFIAELDPTVNYTAKRANKIYVTTKQSAEKVKKIGGENVEELFESGFSHTDIAQLSKIDFNSKTPLRFLSVGRLLDWKGFQLGLKAFALADIPNAEYWIFGDGPAHDKLVNLTKELKIDKLVKFWGMVDRSVVLEKLEKCHGLVHPSLHDSGGWVCLEAMAAGRPVICLDWGGPGFQVTDETGFKFYPTSPDLVVKELSAAMKNWVENVEFIHHKSIAARLRVKKNFTWSIKAEKLNDIYFELVKSE